MGQEKNNIIAGLRNNFPYYGLYENSIVLMFLKYIISYKDVYDKDNNYSIKAIDSFRRQWDVASSGFDYIHEDDINGLIMSIKESGVIKDIDVGILKDLCMELLCQNNEAQKRRLSAINVINFNCGAELIKELFNKLLITSKNDATRTGIYYSSESLRNICLRILDVKKTDSYMDPMCGFSSSLLSLKEYGTYIGYDIDRKAALISNLSSFIISEGCVNSIKCEDFIEVDNKKVDKIFAEPPLMLMNKRFDSKNLVKLYGTNEFDGITIKKIVESLKENGRAVIATTSKILVSSFNFANETRRYLIDNGLRAVVTMGSLFNGASVDTNILVIEKGYNGNISFINAKSLGTIENKEMKLSKEDVELVYDVLSNNKDITEFSKVVKREDVNCSNLMPAFYIVREVKQKYRTLSEVEAELDEVYAKLIKNLTKK